MLFLFGTKLIYLSMKINLKIKLYILNTEGVCSEMTSSFYCQIYYLLLHSTNLKAVWYQRIFYWTNTSNPNKLFIDIVFNSYNNLTHFLAWTSKEMLYRKKWDNDGWLWWWCPNGPQSIIILLSSSSRKFYLCKGSIDTPTQKYSIHMMISYLLHLVSKSVRKMHIYGHPISMNF